MGLPAVSSGVLERSVYAGDRYKPFGEFTVGDVEDRAAELKQVTGWGPTARVGAIARAWSELGRAMTVAGATTVADLGHEAAEEFAARLWITPPGGSLL